jgi:hypothetical protein
VGVAVDVHVDVHRDGVADLLRDLTEQAGSTGKQRKASQELDGKVEVGERCTAHACSVEWQRSTEEFGMHPTDGGEESKVRAKTAGLLRDCEQPRGARVDVFVDGMAETGHKLASVFGCSYNNASERVPAGVIGR